jgi:hypothetical protein
MMTDDDVTRGTSEHYSCTAPYLKRQSCVQGLAKKWSQLFMRVWFGGKPVSNFTVHAILALFLPRLTPRLLKPFLRSH